MTHDMTILVLQVAVIIMATRFLGWIATAKLRQPAVLGEMAAGMLIGPYLLGSLHIGLLHGPLFPVTGGDIPLSPALYGMATVGSVILLFVSGLETDLKTFLRFLVKGSAVGVGGIVCSFLLGGGTAILFLPGVDSFLHPTALFLGAVATATSLGITARILGEKGKLSSPEGVTILSAAVLDDVLSIIMLAIIVGIARISVTGEAFAWAQVGMVALKAIAFWVICTFIIILVAPRITRSIKRFGSLGTMTAVAFGLALFLAGLAELSGLAMIIGAYITGLGFSQTDVAHEIHERIQGLYDFMVPLFFCTMGMMVDFSVLGPVWVFGLLFTFAAVLGKFIGCGVPALLVGFNLRGALRIGAGMQPRGEVTLIIAGIGLTSGAIGSDIFGVAIITLLIAAVAAPPLLVRSFGGGTGYRGKEAGETATAVLDLVFPSRRTADFMRQQVLEAFRAEGFYIHRPDHNRTVYTIRSEDIAISLVMEDQNLVLTTQPEYEQFVRLLMIEELVNLKEFLTTFESMKSPDMMGAELMRGMFAREEASNPADPAPRDEESPPPGK